VICGCVCEDKDFPQRLRGDKTKNISSKNFFLSRGHGLWGIWGVPQETYSRHFLRAPGFYGNHHFKLRVSHSRGLASFPVRGTPGSGRFPEHRLELFVGSPARKKPILSHFQRAEKGDTNGYSPTIGFRAGHQQRGSPLPVPLPGLWGAGEGASLTPRNYVTRRGRLSSRSNAPHKTRQGRRQNGR